MRWLGATLSAVLLLGGCVSQAPVPSSALRGAPDEFPFAHYRDASRQGAQVFRVADSLLIIEIRRGGALARLGHDHVVASRDLQGYILPAAGRADLFLPLDGLTVDEAALRAQSGFATAPTAADIAGTRRNMLGVLDVARHPHAVMRVKSLAGGQADVDLTLHGITRGLTVPLTLEATPAGLSAAGSFSLLQTDFGIAPFSILGGAIQVQDRLDLRFWLNANPVKAAAELEAAPRVRPGP